MKRLFVFAIVLSCTTFSHAWNPPDYSLTFTADTRTVMLSTTPATPTLLLNRGEAQRCQIFTTSMTFITSIALSTSSVFVSTANAFQIPSSTSPFSFSPDGVNSPWAGQLYAVATGTTPFTVSVFKSK